MGNRALKAIKLVQGPDGLKVDDFDLVEHEQILSNAGDNKEGILQTALANFLQRHDLRGTPVAISVSGKESFARFIKLPPVEPKKIPEIVRFEAIQQIPFPLDDVEWSYQLFQSPESPDVEVGIFAMRKELVEKQIKYFADLGLNVQVVQMAPLAVFNAMQTDGRVKGTTMFMDAGAENTDLIIADADTVWLRTLPVGGNNFTEALAKAFKLNFAKAEELKRNAATSKYARQIFQAMRPVFADLVAEVQRSIGFYASVHRDARIKRICALGGTFRLPGLQKYLQQNLQLDVERIDSFRAGAPADGKQATLFSENVVSMAAAYGLAAQAMGQGQINSSLLPERIRREKIWRQKTKWFAAAAAIFVVGTGAAFGRYFYDNWQFEQNKPIRDTTASTITRATGLSNRWTSQVEGVGAADRDRVLAVNELLNYRTLWTDMMSDLMHALPNPPSIPESTPREQRNEIVFTHIQPRYMSDISAMIDPAKSPEAFFNGQALGEDNGSGSPPAVGSGAEQTPGGTGDKRGFLLTIRGYTPHPHAGDGTTFISNTLMTSLKKYNVDYASKNHRSYYIGRISLVKTEPRSLSATATVRTAMAGSVPPAGAGGGNPSPARLAAQATAASNAAKETAFTLLVAVVLDPPPAPEPAGGNTPTALAK